MSNKNPNDPALPVEPKVPADAPSRPMTSRDQVARPPAESQDKVRGKLPKVPADAPLYRVTKKTHFINGRRVEPGETVRFSGTPGTLLEPLDDAAKAARAEADKARAKRSQDAAELRQAKHLALKALRTLGG
jgi:hypothetical protein